MVSKKVILIIIVLLAMAILLGNNSKILFNSNSSEILKNGLASTQINLLGFTESGNVNFIENIDNDIIYHEIVVMTNN